MKHLILERPIAVQCWNVLGQVATASKRPELMAVLLRTRECGHTSAEDVAEHLFFDPRTRRVVAERMLRVATTYGLLTQNERMFSLTQAGHQALDAEQVLVPERGSWTIWASDDPLLEHPILRVAPWAEPSAFDDVQRGKPRDSGARSFQGIPGFLRAALGRVATPPGGKGRLLRIDELDPKGEPVKTQDPIKLVWDIPRRSLRLQGSLQRERMSAAVRPPQIETADVWRHLLESQGLWPHWDVARGTLLVGFDDTQNRERESLQRDLTFATPDLGKLGRFDTLTVQDVPLQARTANDAEHWAAWRLQERLRDYATHERFTAWSGEATAPFAALRVPAASRAELARDAWNRRGARPSMKAWHLAAAEDWSL